MSARKRKSAPRKRLLVVTYDVTAFTDDQIHSLAQEAVVQATDAEEAWLGGHPDTTATYKVIRKPNGARR